MDWVAQEMNTLNLGDKRLNQRVVKVLSDLAGNPMESIPAACGGWRETKAAYRLFDNNKVSEEKLLAPHEDATLERIKSQNTVLLIQDTTSFCFSTQRKRQDVGPITHKNIRGMFLHPILAVTPQRLCLGVLSPLQWSRVEISTSEDLADMRKKADIQAEQIKEQLLKIEALNKNHNLLKQTTKKGFTTAFHQTDFNVGKAHEICEALRALVANIKAYHPAFPENPWPLGQRKPPKPPRDIFDEIDDEQGHG